MGSWDLEKLNEVFKSVPAPRWETLPVLACFVRNLHGSLEEWREARTVHAPGDEFPTMQPQHTPLPFCAVCQKRVDSFAWWRNDRDASFEASCHGKRERRTVPVQWFRELRESGDAETARVIFEPIHFETPPPLPAGKKSLPAR